MPAELLPHQNNVVKILVGEHVDDIRDVDLQVDPGVRQVRLVSHCEVVPAPDQGGRDVDPRELLGLTTTAVGRLLPGLVDTLEVEPALLPCRYDRDGSCRHPR
jgi:hypothetical protein